MVGEDGGKGLGLGFFIAGLLRGTGEVEKGGQIWIFAGIRGTVCSVKRGGGLLL